MNKVRRINLFGGPGSRKSSIAAGLFNQLKSQNYSVELIQEYVKWWAWQNKKPKSFDQIYITANQIYREDTLLNNGCDLIITDSPALMGIVYTKLYSNFPNLAAPLLDLTLQFHNHYPSLNIFLDRGDTLFDSKGRWGSLEEAKIVDNEILNILIENNIDFIKYYCDKSNLTECILTKFNEKSQFTL